MLSVVAVSAHVTDGSTREPVPVVVSCQTWQRA